MNKLIKRYFSNTLKACVIGSGPASYYITKNLLNNNIKTDIFEKLSIPFGLVRYGVAPDHQSLKKLQNDFLKLMDNKNVNFYGNVEFEKDINLDQLKRYYNIIVIAYGTNGNTPIRIDGQSNNNVIHAMEFVKWYNGHPECKITKPNLNYSTASIVGIGNVALDCARILVKPMSEFIKSELSPIAYNELLKKYISNYTK